jgi:hypothetical protein
MTHTTQTDARPATTCTTAITAADFSPSTTDVNRDTWTAGKVRLLVDALAGAPVVLVADRQTGFALVGAVLTRVVESDRVVVRTEHNDTAYSLRNLGPVVMPLTDTRAKWDAVSTWGRISSAAIRAARAEHGEAEGRAWGRWSANVNTLCPAVRGDGWQVQVTYTPSTGNPACAAQWGTRWYGWVSVPRP